MIINYGIKMIELIELIITTGNVISEIIGIPHMIDSVKVITGQKK